MKIIEGTISSPKGFHADGLHCGLKKKKKDIGWIVSDVVANAAAVYTTNQVKAAPISITRKAIEHGQTLQAILVNSAVANACTGEQGIKDAESCQKMAAEKLGIEPNNVGIASTGVIGHLLPMKTLQNGIEALQVESGDSYGFHQAILTTDLVTKEITVETVVKGKTVTMSGVAKGSGMIHPNMATMLSFITTDAVISGELLQELLKTTVDATYNQITIDGDTSTNDMVIIMANGCAENEEILKGTPEYTAFVEMFHFVAQTLAKKVARDGEGATKLIEVSVKNGIDRESSRMIAKKVVGSSLVKSAIFGEDPNWGRIICAIGYAGPKIQPEVVDISLGDQEVLKNGQPVPFNESSMLSVLKQDTVCIEVDLKMGQAAGIAWGCDLTYKYVEINACYHT